MDNNTKLIIGLGLGAAALYFIFRPKPTQPTTTDGNDMFMKDTVLQNPCKDGEVLSDKGCVPNPKLKVQLKEAPVLEEVLVNAPMGVTSIPMDGGFKNYVTSDMMFGLHPFFSNADGGFKNYVSSSFFNTEKQKLNY